ncbi:alpha-1D adrenergic receptor-like [Micropterus dolomieu]|uniref:alpha-1D adrenergic receptor-like n=1 Tax=Micropterus dolomieu TaxID=147949 RepID=UPI001E8E0FC1|nr:alpha-1D adrenergic receptor-like [Micropterus dolomieu]
MATAKYASSPHIHCAALLWESGECLCPVMVNQCDVEALLNSGSARILELESVLEASSLAQGSFFPALKPSETVFKVIFWLGYFNSCINPMIYPCSSKEFQRAFTRLLRCQCHQRQRVLRRFYDQRWRTAVKGMTKDQRGDYKPGYAVHECYGNSLLHKGKGCSLGFKRWSLFPPLQKSSFQLKEKVNNLSNKIKGGTGKSSTPAVGRIDVVDTVSMGIYNSSEQSSYQFYDLADCYGLKETDI